MDCTEFDGFYVNCTPGGEISHEVLACRGSLDRIVWVGTNTLKDVLSAAKDYCKSLLMSIHERFKTANVSRFVLLAKFTLSDYLVTVLNVTYMMI